MLVLALWLLIHLPSVQNRLVKFASKELSNTLKTKVEVKHVDLTLFNRFAIEGIYVSDKRGDTLLYAGRLNIKITDWFFLKDKFTLHYVGLENVSIRTFRSDSTWNHQFILDAFSSPGKNQTSQNKIDLLVEKVEVKQLNYITVDQWRGEDQHIRVASLLLNAKKIDLAKKLIDIKNIDIENLGFSIRQYEGKRPDSLIPKTIPRIAGKLYWNPEQWRISTSVIQLKNSRFQNDIETQRQPYPYFDGAHLLFTDIKGSITDLAMVDDTVKASIDLSTKERSGLHVTSLRSKMRMDPTKMGFYNLDLNTPYSHVGDTFIMSYDYFSDDMAEFVTKVRLRGDIQNSKVDARDIGFFAPELKNKAISINLNGEVDGTVNDLRGKEIKVDYKSNTSIRTDLHITGLPETEKTNYVFTNIMANSSVSDIRTIFPDLEKQIGLDLGPLAKVKYSGELRFEKDNIDTRGNLYTALGKLGTSLSIKNASKKSIRINAEGDITDFEVGRLFKTGMLGEVSGQYIVRSEQSDQIEFETVLRSLKFNDYTFKDIKTGGVYRNKKLNLDLDVDDENLKASLIGIMDLSQKKPVTNIDLKVFSSNLDRIKLTKLPLRFTGSSRINFEGKDIDDITGTAQFYDLAVIKDDKLYSFDSLQVSAENNGGFRSIAIKGTEIDAQMKGNFELKELPATFNQYFSTYYPLYFKKLEAPKKDQDIYFRFDLKNATSILKVLDLGIGGLNYSYIEGSIDSRKKKFSLNASIPKLTYNKVSAYEFILNAEGNADSLIIGANTNSVVLNDSLFFPKNEIKIRSSKDISSIEVNSFSDRSQYGAALSAYIRNLKDGIKIHFNRSSLVFNDKTWNIANDGEVTISRSILEAKNLQVTNGEQIISIVTLPPESNRSQTIILSLTKVNLGDLIPLVFKEPRIQGVTTGDLTLEDPFNDLKLYLNAQTEKTIFEDDSIGITTMNAFWDSKEKRASYFFESDNPDYKLDVKGKFEAKDSASAGFIDMDINVDNVKLSILEPYLQIVFNKVDGIANGKLKISGEATEPDLTGEIDVTNGNVNVAYTQCSYAIKNTKIFFRPGRIDLGTLELGDVNGNKAQLKGSLEHKFFNKFRYDISASSKKLLVLNTTKNDNNLFYGKATARFNFSMTGPEEQMNMYISGTPVDSSFIDINTSTNSKQSAEVDYIIWKTYGKELTADTSFASSNLIIDLDLTASPLLRMNVILDELTGDVISGRGSGNLKIHTGTRENLTMIGRYNIESGSYNFNFQDVFKKPFKLEGGGSSYISWTGDPYNAEININAVYLAEKVRMSTLFNDPSNASVSQVSSDVLKEITDVEVKCNLSGTLAKPNPGFQIVIPQTSAARNNTTIDSKLKTINRDPLEASKQATYLIVFKGFAPQAAVVATDLNSQLINSTISGVINGILSSSVQNFFSKILGSSVDVNFNYSRNMASLGGNTQSTSGQGNFRENVSLQFIKSMMNDKLVITFGSDFNFSATGNSNISAGQTFLFLPDVNVEYKITPDGKFRTSFFYRSKFDVLSSSGKRDRTGGNVSFRTEFDRMFERKKKNLE